MNFKNGIYKTVSGQTAIVAQLRSINFSNWILRGAIQVDENVFEIHIWTSEGKSYSNNIGLNLEAKD